MITINASAMDALVATPLPQRIMVILASHGGEARLVGGVVRDVLNGGDPALATDFDMAVDRLPDDCRRWLEAAGLRVIPTGIDHGTITVLDRQNPSIRAEVTSLRADIRTDGRHAEVVFGTDWLEDARRRDFTINALYLDARGQIFDPFDGHRDLLAKQVKFIGDAETRIKEDYLRMMRFFRFFARFGDDTPDPAAMTAIEKQAAGLARVSGERIAQELRGILAAGHGHGHALTIVLEAMVQTGLDRMIAPAGFDLTGFGTLTSLTPKIEVMQQLGALLYGQDTAACARRLRLSNREAGLLGLSARGLDAAAFHGPNWQQAAYLKTGEFSIHPQVLAGIYAISAVRNGTFSAEVFEKLQAWQRPPFPVTGDDLIARGLAPGRNLGLVLDRLKAMWLAEDFTPQRDDLLKMLDAGDGNE